MISITNLNFSYDEKRKTLSDISLAINKGEAVGIIGANGAGKSTLMKVMLGLLPTYTGECNVCDLSVEKKNYAKIRKHLGYVFQDSESQLFMQNVYEDVAFGPRNYGKKGKELEECVTFALEKIHITHLKDQPVYKLSGGEKKLVAIATILAMNPDVLVMDEPSVALDPKNRRNLIRILNELSYTKLITSHDLDFIWDTCSRCILMNEGRIVADGSTKDILSNKELLEANGLELPLGLRFSELARS